MSRKNELCRNFQRGSCQFGEQCKFLHVTQQQQKPNPFGFGAQSGSQVNQRQQKQNPFGFGVQNSSQSKNASDYGVKYQNQVKPFENKWTRFSPIAPGNAAPSRQTDNQPQANHKCTDPESCKRQIAEDFEHERPLWKLTCYGHAKSRPCDIFGDVSYEELRAAAYQDAKMGMSLQAIVERERNLLNSKLVEFENLLRNPYVIPNRSPSSSPAPALATPFLATSINAPSMSVQNNVPVLVSSFSQLGSTINSGYNNRPLAPTNNAFGNPTPLQTPSQTPSGSRINNLAFGNSGAFGSRQPTQPFGSTQASNNLNFNNGAMRAGSSSSAFSQVSLPHFPNSGNNLLTNAFNGPKDAANADGDDKRTKVPEDMAIWQKEWKRGEIPEEPPPDAVVS